MIMIKESHGATQPNDPLKQHGYIFISNSIKIAFLKLLQSRLKYVLTSKMNDKGFND